MKRAVLIIAALAICFGAAAQTTGKTTTAKSSGASQTTSQVHTKTPSQTKSQTASQVQTKTQSQTKSTTQAKQQTAQTKTQTTQSKSTSQAKTQASSQSKQATNNKQGGSQSKQASNNKQASSQKKQSDQKKDEKKDGKKDINHFNIGLSAAPGLHLFVNNAGKTSVAIQMKAGANATIPIILPDLYLQPGARLALRTGGTHYTGQISNIYLEVPVFAGYNFRLGDIALFVEAGPYAGLRIIPLVHGTWEPKLAWQCPSFDIGLGINAGIELNNKIRLSAGFDRGFISPCKDDHAHNGGFWITATYLLR